MEKARKAGATIAKEAQVTFWGGYVGYFKDPDGHLWEIAWNPKWKYRTRPLFRTTLSAPSTHEGV